MDQYAKAGHAMNLTLKMRENQYVLWKGSAVRVQNDDDGLFVEEIINELGKEYLQEPDRFRTERCIEIHKVASTMEGSMQCKRWGTRSGKGYSGLTEEERVMFSHVIPP